jgi:hypothetical protein
MASQQPPRSSFAALAQNMGVDVLRRQEQQIQQEVQATGMPEWQVRQKHYEQREAERQEMIRLTELRVRELRNPRLREARERAEAEAAARAAAVDRLNRWRGYLAEHPQTYDQYGNVREHRADEPPEWFT